VITRPSTATTAEDGTRAAHWRYGSISGQTIDVLHARGLVTPYVFPYTKQHNWEVTVDGATECEKIREARAYLFETRS